MQLTGRLYSPNSSQNREVHLQLGAEGRLHIIDAAYPEPLQLSQLTLSPQLGKQPLRITLPDQAQLLLEQSDGLLAWLRSNKQGDRIAGWERSLKLIALGVVLCIVTALLTYRYVLPATAGWIADQLPPVVASTLGEQTRNNMEKWMFDESQLSDEQQQAMQLQFQQLLSKLPELPHSPRLYLYSADEMANAFALADGSVVVTDQLFAMAGSADALQGVLLHELGHVAHNDVMHTLVRSTLFTLLLNVVFGDVTGSMDLLVNTASFGVEMSYSRGAEQAADDFACHWLKATGADLDANYQMMESVLNMGHGHEAPEWFSTHPDTDKRLARFKDCLSQP